MGEERKTPLVLVAEDDADILDLVVMVLEEDEYEILTANDGKEAVELAAARLPDLCVLDVMMPKLDGTEVTERIRADQRTREIPIILLSARTQWEAVVRGRKAGADEYLTKPFVADDLLASVHGLLVQERISEPVEKSVLELLEGADEDGAPAPSGLILVAAPDPNLVQLVSYRFSLGGYEVACAHDPEEAEQLVSERSPDLCLLDASMPEPDGCQVKRIEPQVSVQELFGEVEQLLAAPPAGNRQPTP